MSETQPHKARQTLAQIRPYLPFLAVLLAALALWLAWSGWRQMQGDANRAALEQTRDATVDATARALAGDLENLTGRLQSERVQRALAADDLESAAAALAADWPGLEEAAIYLPDLESVYAGLDEGGFGRAAVLESALVEDRPVTWVIREADGPRVALAAPARAGERLVGVAFVRLPMARATLPLQHAHLDEGSMYLGLRQGGVTLLERGNPEYIEAAERMATAVPGTGLRVVAASPRAVAAPFGLAGIPAFAVAAVLLLLAFFVWRVLPGMAREASAEDDQSPTLTQALTEPTAEPAAAKLEVRDAPKPAPVRIDRGIFRAYDIRGVVGESLDAGVAELIGQAIGSLMREKDLGDIVIGRDGRLSGPDLVAGLVEGLRKAGRNVIDIGMVPTPVVYFGAFQLRTGCCISVTGSHNPPDYNGFKIVVGGETLSGDAITDLYARIAEDRLHTAKAPGGLSERDIADDYVDRIANDVQVDQRLKVVVDAGNGVAGEIGPRVLEAIGAEVVPLYCEIDGTFPNHHPDPSDPHNLEDLVRMVQRLDADLGIAFDGDGDRLGVVTREGDNIYPDRLLMLFAADVLERNPGAVIVYDVKCSGRLPGHILRHGGSPLMWKTGHSLIKAKMRETEAELAGEMSGHFFFQERWYGFDDGIYAAARLLEILASRDEAPGEVLRALPNGVSTPEIKVEAPGGDPHAFVERFHDSARLEGARLSTIDGVRADWADGWGLVRASNTTPVLVLRFDADDEQALSRIKEAFREQLLAVDPQLQLPF
ncbi:phosphomannomutase/phosphoglucomutase [Luteimonas sp. RD2P54]|uniref:phosphomannomutase n=1 Tax=Luteimonas endophytica TaxID=3042023 RepID=A0ABT6J8C4_9GAMM|nr:phosphomannomutase/phosphoglucomutase [Luteimonas endophytica]MDH5822443.1 phosphomannomutase/phosphoglucomutase [Luteimonas endophytica]